jgi:hypothetical protein
MARSANGYSSINYPNVASINLCRIAKRFDREGRTWMTLQSNPHENIVEFLGIMKGWNGNQLALVSSYVEDGTVVQYVKKHAGANRGRLVSFIQGPKCVCYTVF